jgi:hypothetical protein
MEETQGRTVSAHPRRKGRPAARHRFAGAPLVALAVVAAWSGACTGRYAGPRTLASLGALAVAGGGVSWATGQGLERNGRAGDGFVTAGFVSVAAGLVAIVAAGGWMAVSVACTADPDCDEEEQCREIPAPPGGVPYKQCMIK